MTYTIYPNHLKKDKYEPFLGHTVYHIYYYTGTEYILEWNLTEKTVKRPFCCTVSILQVYFYSLLGPGTSFYRKSKINIKRKPNYEIGWFHN